MSNLALVSFTGPDDQTDIGKLKAYQEAFPFIEWAILVFPRDTGSPRYPQRDWIHRFLDSGPTQAALHVCGQDVHNFINREPEMWELAQRFNRVQVNFFQGKDPIDPAKLSDTINAYGKPVILPYNPKNMVTNEQVTAPHDVIFDRSGGKGLSPDSWPEALTTRFCTYAGGLGPETISEQFPRIVAAARDLPFGIDMQTGLRDEQNRFDFLKVKSVSVYCVNEAGAKLNALAYASLI